MYKPHCRPGGNTRTQQKPDTQSFFWIRRCFVEEDGACPEDGAYPILPCTVSHFACYSLPQSKNVLCCMSEFPMFQRFFLLQSPPVLENVSRRIQIPMLQIPAELFLSRACYGLTYSFVHFENVRKLICSLFWLKKLESSAERKKQKTRFKLPILS